MSAPEDAPERPDYALGVVWFVAMALAAGLTLAYAHPPLVDWPEHLAQDAIVAHRNDPAFGTSRYYELTGWFLPYQGFRWFHIALSSVLGIGWGGRVALLGYLLGAPLALWQLVARLGRSRWLAVGCLTVLVEANFLWGFAPHALATAMVLGGLVLCIDALLRPERWRLWALVAWGVALFFTHLQQSLVWASSAGLVAIAGVMLKRVPRKRAAAVLATLSPPVLLSAYYLVGRGWLTGSVLTDDFSVNGPTLFHRFRFNVEWIFYAAGLTVLDQSLARVWCVALFGCLALALLARVRRGEQRPSLTPSFEARWAAPVLALWWTLLYFALPAEFRGQTLAPRNASLTLLGWLLVVPAYELGGTRLTRALQLVARALIAAAGVGALVVAHRAFARFERHMAPLNTAIAHIEPGSRVATMVYRPRPWGYWLPVTLHLGGYVLAERGGLASSGFTRTGVTYRSSVPRGRLMVLDLWRPMAEGWVPEAERFEGQYDYLLVFGSPPRGDFGALATGWTLEPAYREGEFSLWRVRGNVTARH